MLATFPLEGPANPGAREQATVHAETIWGSERRLRRDATKPTVRREDDKRSERAYTRTSLLTAQGAVLTRLCEWSAPAWCSRRQSLTTQPRRSGWCRRPELPRHQERLHRIGDGKAVYSVAYTDEADVCSPASLTANGVVFEVETGSDGWISTVEMPEPTWPVSVRVRDGTILTSGYCA